MNKTKKKKDDVQLSFLKKVLCKRSPQITSVALKQAPLSDKSCNSLNTMLRWPEPIYMYLGIYSSFLDLPSHSHGKFTPGNKDEDKYDNRLIVKYMK